MMLHDACRVASREKIAVWCRDGVVASRAGLRVSRIRHLDLGANDTITEENVTIDPAAWSASSLGNTEGAHWQSDELACEFNEGFGIPYGTFKSLVGGTYYRIQVHRNDLDKVLATLTPKARAGRPPGGGYKQSDKLIVEKMHAGIQSRDFTSPTAAAWSFVREATGGGTPLSKVKRLANRYKTSYPLKGELD